MATILIVDDRPANRAYLVSLLGYQGHRLLEAGDGFQGLDAVRAERPDLVIADILMPVMDGYDFVRQIRADAAISGTRVIFWTAQYLEREALALAHSCGVSRILMKPAEPSEVLAIVSEMLSEGGADPVAAVSGEFDSDRSLNDELAKSRQEIKRSNLRLKALFEMSQQLTSEHDPEQLVELYCDTARRIVGVRYGMVAIVHDRGNRLLHFAAKGLNTGQNGADRPAPPFGGIVAKALMSVTPVRVKGPCDSGALGVHPSVPSLQSALVVPLASRKQVYGWLCLGDKIGVDEFNDEDEELAVTLTAQFSVCFENSRLYSKLEEHNVELERRIQERDVLENQFRHAQKMEAVGRLAGGIAHDLNNLLTVILGYTAIASGAAIVDEVRTSLDEVMKAGDRATTLVRQLLAFSRRQVLQPRVIDLNELIDGMQKMLHRVIEENIQLVINLDKDLGMVTADPGQVEQVLMNLVVNSRDAMPRGGRLTIETRSVDMDEDVAHQHVEVPPGVYAMIAVSDTGSGIPAEVLPHIFEPFFTTKELGKGTGLGLSTAFGIVKQSGGTIWTYSEPGLGTTFKVYLPRTDALPEQLGAKTTTPAVKRRETVLLVEDEPSLLKMTENMLERQGHTVLAVSDGVRAVALCESYEGSIDLLITDIVMPNMNGVELATAFLTLRPRSRVLYMSGYTDMAILDQATIPASFVFLEKPFTAAKLAAKIREALSHPGETGCISKGAGQA